MSANQRAERPASILGSVERRATERGGRATPATTRIENPFESLYIRPVSMALPTNIALVHDWLVRMRGGEKCFEALCELFPSAHVFTLLHNPGTVSSAIERLPITTSFLQYMPFGVSRYQRYLPLFPRAIETFDLREYDLVISSSHAVAKGARARDEALHICYCHTPMRYIWDQYDQYFGRDQAGIVTRTAMRVFLPSLRRWDVQSSARVTRFIANSQNVRERIMRLYNRNSEVIYPPVDVHRFRVSAKDDGYFLIVSALVPYKRIDVAINAFNTLGEKLVIVGLGIEEQKLKRIAKSNIKFVGWVDDTTLVTYYERCRALIFPGEEDFGIVPIEAMACGKPVIALARGGVLETVIDNEPFGTGILFHQQTVEDLIAAIRKFERRVFDPQRSHAHTQQFDRSVFKNRILKHIEQAWDEFK